MKIIYKTGDLMQASEPALIHQVNPITMASGIAKLIRDTYPFAYEMYILTKSQGGLALGENVYVPGEPHTIIHAVAQPNYGYDGEQYTDYAALAQCLENASEWVTRVNNGEKLGQKNPIHAIAMGRIGCARGGGSWAIVSEIIELCCTSFQPVVYTLPNDTSWNP
jgi:O-acetyl-ADP-ribose deacetylase (regulator of RNase III)